MTAFWSRGPGSSFSPTALASIPSVQTSPAPPECPVPDCCCSNGLRVDVLPQHLGPQQVLNRHASDMVCRGKPCTKACEVKLTKNVVVILYNPAASLSVQYRCWTATPPARRDASASTKALQQTHLEHSFLFLNCIPDSQPHQPLARWHDDIHPHSRLNAVRAHASHVSY